MLNHVKSLAVRVTSLNSKNRRCAYCKKKVPTETAKINGLKAFCSTDHALAWLDTEKGRITLKTFLAKARHKEMRAAKKKLKTKSQYMKEAQAAFNAYVRYRDRKKPCISCGSTPEQRYGGAIDAGHYRSRGAAKHLALHLWNCHAQCKKCNRNLSGNVVEYRINLIRRIGLDKVESLENNNQTRIYTIEYLERIKRIFKKKVRILKKLNGEG